MNEEQINETLEGEAIYGFFSKVGSLFKAFFIWAWELDGDDLGGYIAGSLLIVTIIACGLLALFGLGNIFWATFNSSWLWVLSWIPAIMVTIIFEIRVVKWIVDIHEDFF